MTIASTPNNRYVPAGMAEYMSRRMRDVSSKINCHLPGTIVSFDTVTQMAQVSVCFQRTIKAAQNLDTTGESADVIIDYPVLIRVPIIVLQGGGGYITFPITAGDGCLLLFCDRDIDVWIETGLINPPGSDRLHDLNDAVALVGLNNQQDLFFTYDGTNVAIHSETSLNITVPNGLASVIDRTGERLAQSGDLKPTARSTAPSGWLLAYGQSISKTTYPDLFAAIGYTYGGSGDNFNVIDMRGRNAVGLDNMGGSNADVLTNAYTPNRNTLGGAIGEETHTLTIPEMPAHTHTYDRETATAGSGPGSGETQLHIPDNTGSTGGGSPHYNVQPGRMINWLIKI